jgi:hypothetical protein
MPGGRRLYKLTELFTNDELNKATKLFIECKNTQEDFQQRCAKEVVQPIIARLNEDYGYSADASSLVYRLEIYVRALRGEERVSLH